MATRKKKRVYKKGAKGSEYDAFHGKKKSKKARARRNKAHRKANPPKGKEVHHTKAHARGSTRVVSRRTNRRIGKPTKK